MKSIILYSTLIFAFIACSSVEKKQNNKSFITCSIIDIQEYEYAFKFKALNQKKDTVFVLSLKENYYNKNNYTKPKMESAEEIKINNEYVFNVISKKPSVSSMEQLGAFIIIEKDTLYKSSNYKQIPPTFISLNTIGKYYSYK
jgi:hypothetical protein